MLNFETTVQDSKSYGDLTLSEVEPILKINLRSNKREFTTKISIYFIGYKSDIVLATMAGLSPSSISTTLLIFK